MSADWLQALSAWLADHPGWLELALFATACIESLAIAGVVVPGVAVIFVASVLAGQTGMPLSEAAFWAGLGAVVGDVSSFALGRLFQGKLHSVWPFSRYPGIILRGERFFQRHGGKSVVIGRFIGPIRPVIPMVAGALLMPWRRFLVFNVSSAAAWALAYVLPGFLVGSAMASAITPPKHFYPVVGISLAVLVAVHLVFFRVQLGLDNTSRVYRWFARHMAYYQATHRFWRMYSSDRPAQTGEFPLASLCLAVGAGSLFFIWAQLSVYTDVIAPFDESTRQWFGQLRMPLLEPAVVMLTLLGDPAVLLAAAVAASLATLFRGYYAAALHLLAAAGLTTLLVWLLKSGTSVSRPELVLEAPSSAAFPSGHATGITVLAALAANFIARELPPRLRWQTYLIFSVPVILVAISRLYLGVHWFSDVVGGLLLGLSITGLIRASYSRYDRIPLSVDGSSVLALAAWLGFVTWYIGTRWESAVLAYSVVPG